MCTVALICFAQDAQHNRMTSSQPIDIKSLLGGDRAQLARVLQATLGEAEAAAGGGEAELLAILTTLQHAPVPKPAWSAALLLDTLRQQQLEPALRAIEAIRFADLLMTQLQRHSLLDEAIRQQLQRLYIPLVKTLLIEDRGWTDAGPACAQLIDAVCESAAGWYGGLGRGGEAYLALVSDTITQLLQRFDGDAQVLSPIVMQFVDGVARENERIAKLERRLCDTEIGALRARRAQVMVIDFYNEKIAGKLLPKAVVDQLHTVFLEQMRLFLIQEGPQSPLWKRWQKLIDTLVWSLQPKAQDVDKQKLYSLIPSLGSELESALHGIERHAGVFAPLLRAVEMAHIDVMKGQLQHAVAVEPLDAGFGVAGVKTVVSRNLMQQAEAYAEGQWFLYKNEQDQVVRCKLALKLPDMDQLLFVNRLGQKVMQKGIEEFAYCLSVKLARPLHDKPLYQRTAHKVLSELASQFAERERALIEAQQKLQREQQERQQQAAREQAQREAEAQQRAAAAAKARAEAEALAQAREAAEREAEQQAQRVAQAEAQARAERDAQHREDLTRMARLSLDSLNIGAWMRLPGTSGDIVHGKLAVKMRSSGRFIFVDRIGIKVAEYLRDELIELLVERKADIIEQSEQFEDRLAKIVGTMRRDD